MPRVAMVGWTVFMYVSPKTNKLLRKYPNESSNTVSQILSQLQSPYNKSTFYTSKLQILFYFFSCLKGPSMDLILAILQLQDQKHISYRQMPGNTFNVGKRLKLSYSQY